ncbi:MAG: glucosamine-6-phosphate deaminase [Lachnospiraceae bacterium]|nr:glucosamine-6-phosphate deaminase [Lachnospiraceae bacterium]
MKIIVTKDYEESCKVVAGFLIQQVQKIPESKLGLATGGTAEGVYPILVEACRQGEVDFSKVTTVNLDEYEGMDPDSEQSYLTYMNKRFLIPAGIDSTKAYVPSGMNDPEKEIALFNEKLYGDDHLIDIQLLGIGVSGHIGFNEPAEELTAGVHIQKLDEGTIQANSRFFENPDDVPREAITMGVGDIMKAAKIVLIATGENKASVIRKLLMDDQITSSVPATVLKMHRDATIVIDKSLAESAGWKD